MYSVDLGKTSFAFFAIHYGFAGVQIDVNVIIDDFVFAVFSQIAFAQLMNAFVIVVLISKGDSFHFDFYGEHYSNVLLFHDV